MSRARADRDAILVALLRLVGGLPAHFNLERFGQEVERWASEGKTPDQIARLIAEQCRACAPTRTATQFLTLQAFRPEGGLFRTVEHLTQAEITATKRRLNREAGQSLVYTLLSEGLTPRRVQGAFDFADEPPPRKVSK